MGRLVKIIALYHTLMLDLDSVFVSSVRNDLLYTVQCHLSAEKTDGDHITMV